MAKFTDDFINVSQNVNIRLDRIETAYNVIEKYFGYDWFEKNKLNPKIIPNVLNMVLLGESILGTEKIKSPRKLIKKLINPLNQDDYLSGISEAQLIYKFVEIGFDNIEYEPRLNLFTKRPDVTHRFNSEIVQYEIAHIKLSDFDREMWTKRQSDLSGKLSNVVKYGSFDVYLLKEEVSDMAINRIVEESSKLLKDNTKEMECLISGVAYLVFDPTGNIQLEGFKTSYPEVKQDGSMATLAHDCVHDRAIRYEKMLGLKKPTTCVAQISPGVDEMGVKKVKIIRILRPSEDKRITLKVINEATQLSKKHMGVVVIDMGNTSARIEHWAQLVKDLFNTNVYDFPSAVWLRSLQIGTRVFGWNEVIVLNPVANKKIPTDVIKSISGKTN